MRRVGFLLLPLLISAACNGAAEETETETTEDSATAGTGTGTVGTDGTDTEVGSTSDVETGTGEPGGDLRGLVNFTYYPADAAIDEPLLGVAGAYRMETFAIDDLFALAGLQLYQPPPPDTLDTLEEYAPLPFAWGAADTWVAAGNGIGLSHADGTGLACLTMADDAYPLYLAAGSDAFDPACAPDPAVWSPETDYSLALFGGELFEDLYVGGAVQTPAAVSVSAPDLSVYNLEIERDEPLEILWTAGDDPRARIVVRVWDQYGQGVVVAAEDDGEYVIPAANLGSLSGGPGFLTITRERSQTINFEAGSVRVLTRHETWGYIDILE